MALKPIQNTAQNNFINQQNEEINDNRSTIDRLKRKRIHGKLLIQKRKYFKGSN